ncbi:MAG: hypothetical protein R3C03_15820 [Pirellulaceae bacterium]
MNRIAPNHNELADADGTPGGNTRLDEWWDNVGQYIEPAGNTREGSAAMVFWLSGLAKNKQYPLTAGTTVPNMGLRAYNTGTEEREVIYEFRQNQMTLLGGASDDMVAQYSQVGAGGSAAEPVVYFELASRQATDTVQYLNAQTAAGETVNIQAYRTGNTATSPFYNEKSFQLITPGIDAFFAAGSPGNTTYYAPSVIGQERDNISNFSQGRLDNLSQ